MLPAVENVTVMCPTAHLFLNSLEQTLQPMNPPMPHRYPMLAVVGENQWQKRKGSKVLHATVRRGYHKPLNSVLAFGVITPLLVRCTCQCL